MCHRAQPWTALSSNLAYLLFAMKACLRNEDSGSVWDFEPGELPLEAEDSLVDAVSHI